jgi:hypothetical protein
MNLKQLFVFFALSWGIGGAVGAGFGMILRDTDFRRDFLKAASDDNVVLGCAAIAASGSMVALAMPRRKKNSPKPKV